jgi:thymidylate synthase (FAD)
MAEVEKTALEIILELPSILKKIEKIGRICYKSEDRITETSAAPFIKTLLSLQHESVLEHQNITVLFICNIIVFDFI